MYCDQCGTLAAPTAKFCRSCGRNLVAPDKTAEESGKSQAAAAVITPPATQEVTLSELGSLPNPQVEATEPTKEAGTTFHPWRRLFARTVDMTLATPFLYLLLFYPIGEYPLMEALFGTNNALTSLEYPYALGMLFTILFVPVEAALLSVFGSTPGKWAFGLQLRDPEGAHLSYGQAFSRAFGVLLYGLGFGIPLVSAGTGIYSYRKLKTEGTTNWDDEGRWSIRYRSWTFIRAILCAFILLLTVVSTALMPIMIAQFNRNYWAERAALAPLSSSDHAPKKTVEPLADKNQKNPENSTVAKPESQSGEPQSLPVAKAAMPSEPTDRASQFNLALKYMQGSNGFDKSDAEAIKWFKKAAEQGHAMAQFNLAVMYLEGRNGLPKDELQAATLFAKSADQGYAPAQNNLGMLHAEGRGRLIAKDEAIAVQWYEKAAVQGLASAQNNLGAMFLQGRGLKQNDEQAANLFKKSADQNYAPAQNNLGFMYEAGRGGVARDDVLAAQWYRKAAQQGYSLAQNSLALMYMQGRGGIAQDEKQAAIWFRKAANQGHAFAQVMLGGMYQEGRGGMTQDDVQAVKWFRKAAEKGNSLGQYALGVMYRDGGRGVSVDKNQAKRWFKRAASQGDAEAQAALAGFEK